MLGRQRPARKAAERIVALQLFGASKKSWELPGMVRGLPALASSALLALATASLPGSHAAGPRLSNTGTLGLIFAASLSLVAAPLPGQHSVGAATSTSPLIQALVDNDGARALEMIAAGDHPVDAIDVITPLFAAIEYVSSSKLRHRVVKALLRAGAPVDQTTIDGSTPLMLAAYRGALRAAMELLERGADPLREKEVDGNVQTPISAALHANNHEIAELIREYIGESGARLHAGGDAPKTEL